MIVFLKENYFLFNIFVGKILKQSMHINNIKILNTKKLNKFYYKTFIPLISNFK